MRRIYQINSIANTCGYFYNTYAEHDTNCNNGYNCDHPRQEETCTDDETGKVIGRCHAWSCPLGYEADEEDFFNPEIDQNGYTEWQDGEFIVIDDKRSESGADFDSSGNFRFSLWRIWDKEKPRILFLMLNPSTANDSSDDPTIRRCVNFAKSWGYGGIEVVNLFALVSSDPAKLLTTTNSIGTNNDLVILDAASRAGKIIVAWGAFGVAKVRSEDVLGLLHEYDIYCLGKTKAGHPKHPLYLRSDLSPVIYAWKDDKHV